MIYMNASVIGLGHNEFERGLAERQIRRPLVNQRAQAAALTTAGKFVICANSEVTCRWSDALIGYDFHIVKVCDTIEEARAQAASSGYVFLFHLELPALVESSAPDADDLPSLTKAAGDPLSSPKEIK
jgi:hypothetical protein